MSFLGVDIGTSGCKVVAFNRLGHVLHRAYRPWEVRRNGPSCAELDVREVWCKIQEAIAETAAATPDDPPQTLGATSMGEAFVTLEADGTIDAVSLLGSDTRNLAELDRIYQIVPPEELHRITKHHPGPGYALHNLAALRHRARPVERIFFWADFVTWQLTGVVGCNQSLAARSLLYDCGGQCWSGAIAAAAGVSRSWLPELVVSGTEAGTILPEMAKRLGLPKTLRIFHGSHDQCAHTLGAGVCRSDQAMLGLGTFACMVLTGDVILADSALDFEPHIEQGKYVSFLYHGSGGALIQWLRKEFYGELPDEIAFRQMDREAENSRNPAVVLPYFAAAGAPEYRSGGNGAILGLSLAHTRADIYRAALEGIAFYFRRALETLAKPFPVPANIHVTGGGANSRFWLQMIADTLGCEVRKPSCPECGALGMALATACGIGVYPTVAQAVAAMVSFETTYVPSPLSAGRLEMDYRAYCIREEHTSYVS